MNLKTPCHVVHGGEFGDGDHVNVQQVERCYRPDQKEHSWCVEIEIKE